MCTVVIRVPESGDEPTRVLAIRDEDPARPWNPLGRWWPEAHEVHRLVGGDPAGDSDHDEHPLILARARPTAGSCGRRTRRTAGGREYRRSG